MIIQQRRLTKFQKSSVFRQTGFTLIELLVVIGLLAILLTIVLIAINPAKQFSQANNIKRRSDVNAILNAINQHSTDNKGALPAGITTISQEISGNGANICSDLVTKYLAQLPTDPLTNGGAAITVPCPATYSTNYRVIKSATDNRVTVSAPDAELGDTIDATR